MKYECLGEFLGTFILVLFGCGAVGAAVVFEAFGSLLEVAIIWGAGVTIAIFVSRNLSPAHLNPAVTIGAYVSKKIDGFRVVPYIISQFLGAFAAALALFLIFDNSLSLFEVKHGIVRGTEASVKTAMMFGEFFPNPAFQDKIAIGWLGAASMEAFGTFLLVFIIFKLTERKEQADNTTPLFIGLTVTLIICLVAPFTQAGLNPARDFGPRVLAYFGGWREAAFPTINFGFFTVYMIGPVVGGVLAALLDKVTTSDQKVKN